MMKGRKAFLIMAMLLASVLLAVFATSSSAQERIILAVGQQKSLTVSGIRTAAIGDPSIADIVSVGRNKILLIGKRAGVTDLLVWIGDVEKTYVVEVVMKAPKELSREVQILLRGVEGVRVQVAGSMVVLEGRALSKADLDRLQIIAERYPQVINLVKLDPSYARLLAQQLNTTFVKHGIEGVTADVIGPNIYLEGEVLTEEELKKVEMIANSLGGDIVNLAKVGVNMRRMIILDVNFVEMSRSDLNNLGLEWGPALSPTANLGVTSNVTNQGFDPIAGVMSASVDYSIILHMLSQKGRLRILAKPRLVCKSGEKAKFLAGGEIPLPAITQTSSSVEFKDYGIKLEIEPTADRQDNISTIILAEVSMIDEGHSVGDMPGFLTRKVETTVNVRGGQTIALTGLVSHQDSKTVSKMPVLGHIPIIGELFKSRKFRKDETELVVFVTPRIIDTSSDINQELLRKYEEIEKEGEDQVKFNVLD